MAVKRYIPIHQVNQKPSYASLERLQSDIDDAFSSFGLPSRAEESSGSAITKFTLLESDVEIIENTEKYAVTISIAGVAEDKVRLALTRNKLILFGEKEQDTEYQEKGFCLTEHSYSSFERVLYLPDDIAQERINARFEGGRLVIFLPKKANHDDTRAIYIEKGMQ